LKIPHLIGLIVAGTLIGPYGFNLMLRDSSIILFGTVGLLYIMFLSGLETNMKDFKKNFFKSIVFSLLTFLIPMGLGILSSIYVLNFSLMTSVLLASMYASNTLITYPMVSKLGITKNRVVNVAVSGTLVTTVLALLVLAVIVGMTQGEVNQAFWMKISISMILFVAIIMVLFPMIARWFFKQYDDNISQYIFVLGLVYMGAFLAETAGIDKIVGAFLAGLALNSLIPQTSPLMNRINFVGNALFIPFFLIGVGMLIDYQAFFKDTETILVATIMTAVATFSKFAAAWLTQKFFVFSKDERSLLFGLTNAQAASTLAAVLVGYGIIIGEIPLGEPIRLLNESVLNGTILMILITCTIASFATQKGGQRIALLEATANQDDENETEDRILVPINNPETTDELINLGVTLKPKKIKHGLYALNIITTNHSDTQSEKQARALLHRASVTASATDNHVQELLRYDYNIVSGIANVVKEHKISDIIMGLHKKKGLTGSFIGHLSEGILTKCNTTTLIYKPVQPLSTIKRHLVIMPNNAEKVLGFPVWVNRMVNIAKNTGAKLIFYGSKTTLEAIVEMNKKVNLEIECIEFFDWNDFLIISRDLRKDDNLTIVLSRKDHISYNQSMNRIPHFLNRYFTDYSYLLIYPVQRGVAGTESNLLNDSSMAEPFRKNIEMIDDLGKSIGKIFSKKDKETTI
jgi:Kef-type K+ transport system membrane component KefB